MVSTQNKITISLNKKIRNLPYIRLYIFFISSRCLFFYLVLVRCWPLIKGLILSGLVGNFVFWFHLGYFKFFVFCFYLLVLMCFFWRFDTENWPGFRRAFIIKGIRFGIIFFIVSEIFLFLCFFWGYFHKCFSPSFILVSWPPASFIDIIVDPFGVPFLNTVLLLSSGVRITLCHHSLIHRDRFRVVVSFRITLIFGFLFLFMQFEEYRQSFFSLGSTTYGSIFYILTGFHGAHVVIGLFLISFCFLRFLKRGDFSMFTIVSFEAAAWYWHFVDVVWIFLFIFVYLYGS